MHNKLIFRAECFAAYGLNKRRNFLEADELLDLVDIADFSNWAIDEITYNACPDSAIFGIALSGRIYIAINDAEADQIVIMENMAGDYDVIGKIDAENRLCCYGLIVEYAPGYWRVVTD